MTRLFKIGWYWLLLDCGFFAIVGLIFAWFPDAPIFSAWIDSYNQHFGITTSAQRDFLLGPLGGTIFGFYIISGLVVGFPLKQKQRWAWFALALSLIGWFLVDSVACAGHGAWFNIKQINCMTLLMQGIPLLLVFPLVFRNRN